MDKTRRFRERVLKGNIELIIDRARSHGMDRDKFIQKMATSEFIIYNKSTISALKLAGISIPKDIKTILPPQIIKKTDNNTEIFSFSLTDKEYEQLFDTALNNSFTNRGCIGQLFDQVAIFEIVFQIDVNGMELKTKLMKGG